MTGVKICGITKLDDALACVEEGVDTLGINFWSGSKRRCPFDVATEIAAALKDRVQLVGVFVDAPLAEIRETLRLTGISWAQLHGEESPIEVAELLPNAYKAIGVGSTDPLSESRRFRGEHILLDALVPGALPGGTGTRFDWQLARAVSRERKLTLAGGLDASNVAEAIRVVAPFRVDVASGVESAPGVKDLAKVRAFVAAVRAADGSAE